MSFSIDVVEDAILTFLDEEVFPGQDVFEQTIQDTTILAHNAAGAVKPYVAVQIGELRYAGNETFAGVRSADYILPVKAKVVVSGREPQLGRRLRSRFYNLFYGAKFDWAGEIRPLEGITGEFPLRKNDATEALILPVGVGIVTQFMEIEDP